MNLPDLDSDTGTWVFRMVLLGIAFLLGLDVREAKRNLTAIPGLAKEMELTGRYLERLEDRISALEQRK